MSYTKLPRLKVIDACEASIASIEKSRIAREEKLIQDIMDNKFWFARAKTRDKAIMLMKSATFDYNFNIYLDRISAENHCSGQMNHCINILALANASNEEFMFISVGDYYWFGDYYE